MNQNSACSEIPNTTHPAIVLLDIHQTCHCQRPQQDVLLQRAPVETHRGLCGCHDLHSDHRQHSLLLQYWAISHPWKGEGSPAGRLLHGFLCISSTYDSRALSKSITFSPNCFEDGKRNSFSSIPQRRIQNPHTSDYSATCYVTSE